MEMKEEDYNKIFDNINEISNIINEEIDRYCIKEILRESLSSLFHKIDVIDNEDKQNILIEILHCMTK